ncbi:hypothetical protein [Thomasclavelia cocleata]|uniref:hypothetical protein n=1 Tax=Thomasclavelia cocleata TaxID=69824 RepID=UPI00242B4FA8|nr:hypothetical protein [Thomasclavelia cocleata]
MLRDYEIALLEEMLQNVEEKISKDFLEEYKKLKKILTKDEELSAEEMFKELGYEQTSYLGMLMYKNIKSSRTILFMENDAKGHEFKGVNISSTDKGFAMNIELLTAIDKQLKELGWI